MGVSFEVGQTVGEYEITGVLGRGGLGAVYRATHTISQRAEAMKVLLPQQSSSPEMGERFRREIQLLAALNHPRIAGLHSAFYSGDQLIMMMELVEGEDLHSYSRRHRIPLPQLLDVAAQVLDALGYAHGQNVVHRDIKPANIMITAGGLVKVLDFGIALTEQSKHLTAVGAIIGSPTHMSPEQIRGEKATPQSDLYSFGVTLYELIAGEPPIKGETTYQLLMGHLNKVPVPLHELRADIPLSLSNVLATALEKEPGKRFATAAHFNAALRTGELHTLADATTVVTPATWQRASTDQLAEPIAVIPDLPLEEVTRRPAEYIGPIAKIVVNRLAKQCTQLDQLYAEAAKQIDNEGERQKFLRRRAR